MRTRLYRAPFIFDHGGQSRRMVLKVVAGKELGGGDDNQERQGHPLERGENCKELVRSPGLCRLDLGCVG